MAQVHSVSCNKSILNLLRLINESYLCHYLSSRRRLIQLILKVSDPDSAPLKDSEECLVGEKDF